MTNALAEYADPSAVIGLEKQIVSQRAEFLSISELRSQFFNLLAEKTGILRVNTDELPFPLSVYRDFIEKLPLTDVQKHTAKMLTESKRYPHLARSSHGNRDLKGGRYPVSIIARLPTPKIPGFISQNDLKVGPAETVIMLQGKPHGLRAEDGIRITGMRMVVGDRISGSNFQQKSLSVLKDNFGEVVNLFANGRHKDSVSLILDSLELAAA